MKQKKIVFVSVMLCGSLWAQSPGASPTPLSPARREWFEAEISQGAYIPEAGKTGDKSLIPALRKHLAEEKDPENRKRNRMALARLSDQEQLQYTACQQYDPEDSGLVALKYIGGWFSIQILRQMIIVDLEDRQHKKHSGPRVGLNSAGDSALLMLQDMVPNPPYRFAAGVPANQTAEYEQKWLTWLNENETQLRNLEPIGDDVILSKAYCKKTTRKSARASQHGQHDFPDLMFK